MRARIKFSKQGCMIYIGHLDIMRYFQKAIRRSGIKAQFSTGFSPHMIMSFAQPLRVGVSSTGEYFDVDLDYSEENLPPVQKMKDMLNEVMAEGVTVDSVVIIPEDKKNKCMSLVSGAIYSFDGINEADLNRIDEYMSREKILILNQTKKSSNEIDIKPMIIDLHSEDNKLVLKCRCGSEANLKPELFLKSYVDFCGGEYDYFDYKIKRVDTLAYNKEEKCYVPLDEIIVS